MDEDGVDALEADEMVQLDDPAVEQGRVLFQNYFNFFSPWLGESRLREDCDIKSNLSLLNCV